MSNNSIENDLIPCKICNRIFLLVNIVIISQCVVTEITA